MRGKVRVNSEDFFRAVLTETAPYEVPVIFNNRGFYFNVREFLENETPIPYSIKGVVSCDVDSFLIAPESKLDGYTIPLQYEVKKDQNSLRELYLLHPYSQFLIALFYRKYWSNILYVTSKSEVSLRYPDKVSSITYKGNSLEDDLYSEYLLGGPDASGEDQLVRISSTFFSYQKHRLIHKFFDSYEFIKLEKRFKYYREVDVSKCFASIYTHSISWAIKGKKFSKENRSNQKGSFEDNFDNLMMSINYRETNGIPVGPELSRIFAEILFQAIDDSIVEAISKYNKKQRKDYHLRRYVDNFFIFSRDKKTLDEVNECIVRVLSQYKLYLNESKTITLTRPLLTPQTQIKSRLSETLDSFFSLVTDAYPEESGIKRIAPRKDISKVSFVKFIKHMKAYALSIDFDLSGYSGFAFSIIEKQLFRVMKQFTHMVGEVGVSPYGHFFFLYSELILYIYSVKGKASDSLQVARILAVTVEFSKKSLPGYSERVLQSVHQGINAIIHNFGAEENLCELDKVNFLLLADSLGEGFEVNEEETIEILFPKTNEGHVPYFSITAALYISKNKPNRSKLKTYSAEKAINYFKGAESIYKCSQSAHLFLDLMSCPYLGDEFKEELAREAFKATGGKVSPSDSDEIKSVIEYCRSREWFISWDRPDFYKNLIRKRLKPAYP